MQLILAVLALAAAVLHADAVPINIVTAQIDESDSTRRKAGAQAQVTTKNGVVNGAFALDGSHRYFFGVPFAAPPVGDLRWAAPTAAAPWSSPLDATKFSAGCPQDCMLPVHTCPATQSEDCLYLNVYAPAQVDAGAPAKVIVFFPGGRFEQGSAGVQLYDGGYLANATGLVVVTTNYRLGALGWMATGEKSANWGLQDQRMVLQWVQDNIAAFGGDPTKVTISGQSAGGTSVTTHLVSEKSNGLYHQAIIVSNPIGLSVRTTKEALHLAELFAKDIGCANGDVACLRSKNVTEVLAAQKKAQNYIPIFSPVQSFYPWTPMIDGDNLADQPLTLLNNGAYNKVPILAGHVSQEAKLFIYQAATVPVIPLAAEALLKDIFKSNYDRVLKLFPVPHNTTDTRPYLSDFGTKFIFECPIRQAVGSIGNYQEGVWFWNFDHVLSYDAWEPDYPYCADACCHGEDLSSWWTSGALGGWYTPTAAEDQLSHQMATYWGNFVNNGDPNVGLAVPMQWPKYNVRSDTSILLNLNISTQTGLHAEQCQLLDEIGYFN